MDVSVIIINFNTYELTCNCIQSVQEHTKEIWFEVILIDNDSTEEESVLFEKKFPWIRIIRSKQNVGFSKGNNAGIMQASGEYILLLNSDTVLKENSIKKTHDYLKRHPEVGAVSARLIYPDGRHQSVAQRFPSLFYQTIELLRVQKILPPKKRGQLLLGAFFDHKNTVKVDWIWGAYFMFPKKILAALPGNKLDDDFFMYAEDMQWCKDFKRLGYEIHFYADTEVIHFMGGSSGAKRELMKQNNALFLKRNYISVHRRAIRLLEKLLHATTH